MPQLILIALATLVSEDLTSIGTGVLIAQGRLAFWPGTAACLLGIFGGDLLLFLAGRFAGSWPLLRRLVSAPQLERASAWLDERGAAIVLASRFLPGSRLPTYFAAGMLHTRAWRFALYFLIAAAVWTPLLIGLTALFGERALRAAFLAGSRGTIAVLAGGLIWIALRSLLQFRIRRRLIGLLKRKARWEFWPAWAIYLPVVPYLAWLAIKHRSATLFTLANPGIFTGGLIGESKSEILAHLDRVEGAVAAYTLLRSSLSPEVRIRRAHEFIECRRLQFPVVVKPDTGERGAGVSIVRSLGELDRLLTASTADAILQEYVDGPEFGVFYVRYPGQPRGRVVSITEKRLPIVTGDGHSTVAELVLRDPRAVCLAPVYLGRLGRAAETVPARGESVPLAELGSHCRGAVFLDGRRFLTLELECAIERISRSHPGFYFGRYDVRAASLQDFRDGRLKVIELNGVASEATHVYDPAVGLLETYRTMFRLWRTAFAIGACNRRRGVRPMSGRALLRAVRTRGSQEREQRNAWTVEALD